MIHDWKLVHVPLMDPREGISLINSFIYLSIFSLFLIRVPMGTMHSNHGGILKSPMKQIGNKILRTENGWMFSERFFSTFCPVLTGCSLRRPCKFSERWCSWWRKVTTTEEEYWRCQCARVWTAALAKQRLCSKWLIINVRGSWELIPPYYASALIFQGKSFITTRNSKHGFFSDRIATTFLLRWDW